MTSRLLRQMSVVLSICLCLAWHAAEGVVNPPITTNLLVGLDGSDVVTLGGAVRSWNDQATFGGRQDFGNEVSGVRPMLLSNQLMPGGGTANIVDFTVSPFLESKSSIAASATTTIPFTAGSDSNYNGNQWSWFIVFRPQGMGPTATADIVLRNGYSSGASTASNNIWGTFTQNDSLFNHSRTSTGPQTNNIIAPSTNDVWYLSSSVWNGTAAIVNGNAAQSLSSAILDQFGGLSTASIASGVNANPSGHVVSRIGANSTQTLGNPPAVTLLDGQIAEVLIYKSALSAADHDAVQAYLRDKYFGAPAASNYEAAVLADAPVAYWRFNAAAGAYPSEVGNLPGTPSAGVDRVQPGPRGAGGFLGFADVNIAPRFDGSATGDGVDRIDVADHAVLDPGTGDFTIEAWLRVDALPSDERLAIARLDAAGRNGYTLGLDADGTLAASFRMPDGPGAFADEVIKVNTPSTPTLGDWLHVAAVLHRTGGAYPMSGASFFVNGELLATTLDGKLDGVNIDSAAALQFGQLNDALLWDGLLDEVALYPRALTIDELMDHFEFGRYGASLPDDPPGDGPADGPGDGSTDGPTDGPGPGNNAPPADGAATPEPATAACAVIIAAALWRRRARPNHV